MNAKNHEKEAEIIENAGQRGAVTIATNMAGRGTDIKLGEGVREVGGLAVIGTERHESRRIDNQLRGRSGRQGDPGITQFYLSMEDELMRRFGSENMMNMMDRLGMDDTQPIQSKIVSRAVESAQKRVEGNNFDARKQLLQYDDVLRQQREVIYKQRFEVLDSDNLREIVEKMLKSTIERAVGMYTPKEEVEEDWNIEGIIDYMNANILTEDELAVSDLRRKDPEEMSELIYKKHLHIMMRRKQTLAKSKCVSSKKLSFFVQLIQNGWITSMQWISFVRVFIYVLTDKTIRYVNIKWKASRCLKT